jgi:2-polyprenyl-3-methyl-5-hydroxy-6-metoxy-1,4-benzoquinol methylase
MNCIVCNREWKPIDRWTTLGMFNGNEFQIEFCECGVGKTILKSKEDLVEVNSNMYDNLENRIKVYYRDLHNHISTRYSLSLSEITKFTSGRRLLEVGSNIGFTLNIARTKGFVVTGCEINSKCRQLSELLYEIDPIEDFFSCSEKFDIVIMNDVLEHFENPKKAIEQAKKVLNNNGVIFIQLPNIESKRATKLKGNWEYVLAPDHTYHFSQNSLITLLESNGLDLKWIRTASGVDDLSFFKILPKRLAQQLLKVIHNNGYYHPKLYTKKKGVLIQAIFQKKGNE